MFCHFLVLTLRCEGTTESRSSKLEEARDSMTGELEGQLDGIEDPSQDDLSGRPRGVAVAIFLPMPALGDARSRRSQAGEIPGRACGVEHV
jgi:hypothetical protein